MKLNSLYIRDFHIHFSYTSASILTNNFRIFIFRYYVLGVIRSSRNNGFSTLFANNNGINAYRFEFD